MLPFINYLLCARCYGRYFKYMFSLFYPLSLIYAVDITIISTLHMKKLRLRNIKRLQDRTFGWYVAELGFDPRIVTTLLHCHPWHHSWCRLGT